MSRFQVILYFSDLVLLGTSGLASYKEKFTVVDNEKYIKEAEAIEGGFLDLGFEKYLVRFEIVGQEDGPTIIRSTIKYKVDAEHESNASLVSTGAVAAIADAITKYIKEHKSPKQASEQTSEEQATRQKSGEQGVWSDWQTSLSKFPYTILLYIFLMSLGSPTAMYTFIENYIYGYSREREREHVLGL